jgi:hypothetical protein
MNGSQEKEMKKKKMKLEMPYVAGQLLLASRVETLL